MKTAQAALALALLAAASSPAVPGEHYPRGKRGNRKRTCPKCGKSTHRDGDGVTRCNVCPWSEARP